MKRLSKEDGEDLFKGCTVDGNLPAVEGRVRRATGLASSVAPNGAHAAVPILAGNNLPERSASTLHVGGYKSNSTRISGDGQPRIGATRSARESHPVSPPLPSAFKQLDTLSRPRVVPAKDTVPKNLPAATNTAIPPDTYIDSLFCTSNNEPTIVPNSRLHSPPRDATPANDSFPLPNYLPSYGVRKTNSGSSIKGITTEKSPFVEVTKPDNFRGFAASEKSSKVDSAIHSIVNAFSRLLSNFSTRNAKKKDDDGSSNTTDWMSFLNDPSKATTLSLASSGNDNLQAAKKQSAHNTGILLLCLVLVFYIIIQISTGIQEIRKGDVVSYKRNPVKSTYARPHEEGMDRPNSVNYLRMVHQQRMSPQRVVGGVLEADELQPATAAKRYSPQQQQRQDGMTGLQELAEPKMEEAVLQHGSQSAALSSSPEVTNQVTPSDSLPSDPVYNNIANVDSQRLPGEIPVFWHVPKAGGGSFKEVMGQCLGLTLGCELGGEQSHAADTSLQVFEIAGKRVVNVDTYKPSGIEKARNMNLGSSSLADVIVSPYLHEVSRLFSPNRKGRVFVVLRDPIERAVSTYGFQEELFLKQNPGKAFLTLDEYAKSSKIENNWLVRFITNRLSGPLTPEDLELAKEILRAKCLVGLLDKKEESWQRFLQYFGWDISKTGFEERIQQCTRETLAEAPSHRKFSRQVVQRDGPTRALLMAQNALDIELYLYAIELFDIQKSLFETQ